MRKLWLPASSRRTRKVTVRYLTSIVSLEGGELPSTITFRNNETGETTSESYDEGSFGVFVFVGRVARKPTLVEGLVELDPSGYVITDERMATKTPGLYAAGDVPQDSAAPDRDGCSRWRHCGQQCGSVSREARGGLRRILLRGKVTHGARSRRLRGSLVTRPVLCRTPLIYNRDNISYVKLR